MNTQPKFYVVGGAVRDVFLGREPKDVDYVVVGADHDFMINKGFTKVGAAFPVYLDSNGDEWALARTEQKTGPGYHGFDTRFDPSVTIEQDLARRDLTINAMAVPLEDWNNNWSKGQYTNIVDPFNGQADLLYGILRHTTEAFAEDPLRVLRVGRFLARYNFKVAEETKELAKRLIQSGEIDLISKERVWKELEKGFSEDHAEEMFKFFDEIGALNAEPLASFVDDLFIGKFDQFRHLNKKYKSILILKSISDKEALRLKIPNEVQKVKKIFNEFEKLHIDDFNNENVFNFVSIIRDFNSQEVILAQQASFGWAIHRLHAKTWAKNFDKLMKAVDAINLIDFEKVVEGDKSTIKDRVKAAKMKAIESCVDSWRF